MMEQDAHLAPSTQTLAEMLLTTMSLAAALILIVISFRFEEVAYLTLLGDVGSQKLISRLPWAIAECMAFAFAGAKIACVYILVQKLRQGQKALSSVWAMRLLLVVLSLFATLMVVAGGTVSPQAEQRVVTLRSEVDSEYRKQAALTRTLFDQKVQNIETGLLERERDARDRHTVILIGLNTRLDAERKTGIGARYKKLEAQIADEKSRLEQEMRSLRDDANLQSISAEDQYQARVSELSAKRDTVLKGISLADVSQTDEAQSGLLVRTATVVEQFVPGDGKVSTITMTIIFTMLLCLGVEFAPLMILHAVFSNLSSGHIRARRLSIADPADCTAGPMKDQPFQTLKLRTNRQKETTA